MRLTCIFYLYLCVKQVLEETGFDISNLIDREEYIEYKMHEQLSRLYLVPGVSKETAFAPRTRKEIKVLLTICGMYIPLCDDNRVMEQI